LTALFFLLVFATLILHLFPGRALQEILTTFQYAAGIIPVFGNIFLYREKGITVYFING
jgi:hypothetical protein